jgi:hypothetical protein
MSEDTASSSHAGFIAQEVKPLFPDLVSEDENGTLSVAYGGFVVYVVQALKELASGVTDLKNSLARLVHTDKVETKILCVGEEGNQTCISKSQLDSLLQQNNTSRFTPAPAVIEEVTTTTSMTTIETVSSSTETTEPVVSLEIIDATTAPEDNINTITNEN